MLGRLGSTLLQCSRFGRVSRSLNLFRLGIYDASDAGGLFEEMAVSVVAQGGHSYVRNGGGGASGAESIPAPGRAAPGPFPLSEV